MATYYHGSSNSEIQSSSSAEGGLQTLHLMNPTYVPYSDAPLQHHPLLLLNNPHALNLANLSHAPPQQQHHLLIHGVPNILGSTDPPTTTPDSEYTTTLPPPFTASPPPSPAAVPRAGYNLWGQVVDQPSPTATTPSPSSAGGYRGRPSQQGLSLSLSSEQTGYGSNNGQVAGIGNSPSSAASNGGVPSVQQGVIMGSKYLKAAQELLDEVVNVGKEGILYKDEEEKVANNKEKMKAMNRGEESTTSGGGDQNSAAAGRQQGAELSTAQRQELQMKKSKLVNMLDEVEQRYRQYHHQMQIVISSFEQAAGYGAAKSYTSLALKTISKQFRCLKDAICGQIRATSKALGEDDNCLGVKVEGSSRLRYVDHHLRQQRALQQLGMIQVQPNAWRPQRGLPERAVSILRAWLFEHFLHPYPKDSDKVMLAKQTGLARSQVSNWFINARVRLWKPMVEEMYMEEIKEQEHANGSDNNNRSKETTKELGSTATINVTPESAGENKLDHQINNILQVQSSKQESFNNNNRNNTSPTDISTNSPVGGGSLQSHSAFRLIGSTPNKPRSSEIMQNSPSSILSVDMEMRHHNGGDHTNRVEAANTKFGMRHHNKDGYPLMSGANNANHNGGVFGAFSMDDDIAAGSRFNVPAEQLASTRFHIGNGGVSLTLGLPHNENLNQLPMSGTGSTQHQHGFLSQNMNLGLRRLDHHEMGTNNGNEFCAINNTTTTTTPSSHSGTSYESIDIQNRKRFASQLLPDFVV